MKYIMFLPENIRRLIVRVTDTNQGLPPPKRDSLDRLRRFVALDSVSFRYVDTWYEPDGLLWYVFGRHNLPSLSRLRSLDGWYLGVVQAVDTGAKTSVKRINLLSEHDLCSAASLTHISCLSTVRLNVKRNVPKALLALQKLPNLRQLSLTVPQQTRLEQLTGLYSLSLQSLSLDLPSTLLTGKGPLCLPSTNLRRLRLAFGTGDSPLAYYPQVYGTLPSSVQELMERYPISNENVWTSSCYKEFSE